MKMLSFKWIKPAALSILIAAFLFSCKKENSFNSTQSNNEEQAVTSAEESTVAEASFDDVSEVAMVAADEEGAASVSTGGRFYFPSFQELRSFIGDCATISVFPNDSTYPKTITIDFGDSCVGRDGKVRKGKIVIHLTAPLRHSGSVTTITFVNFYVNRVHLEGTKIISNLSEDHTIKFTVQVVGGKLTLPSGRGFSYESLKYKKQIEGMDTRIVRDNVFQITGESKTEFNNGLTIKINIVDPLIKKVACHWISDGTLKIKINEREFKLDYGFPNNGDCDNKALLSWNNGNNQRVILLP